MRDCARMWLLLLLLLPTMATAQEAPRAEDVETLNGIIAAWYDIVSVDAGETPDWARDSTLYLPEVRFVILVDGAPDEVDRASILDHAQFAEAVGESSDGFFESEIHRVTQRFDNMVHVFSTYEFGQSEDGPIMGRGINSIQLFFDGQRWWIVGAAWRNETTERPIPEEFLP
jgi:hypothetical protein